MTLGQVKVGRTYYVPPAEYLPKVSWGGPPKLSELPSWRGAKRVAVDLETCDPQIREMGPGVRRRNSFVCGVAFAIEDGPAHYLPTAHDGGDNCEGDVWAYLRDQLRDFNGALVGANIEYDLDWLEQMGCGVLDKTCLDVQVADPLINELHFRYSLDELCRRYELPGKDEDVLTRAAAMYRVPPKSGLWRLPARFVAQYAIVDVLRPLQILRRQERLLEQDDLNQIWELERRVTPILVKMRRRGVRVDLDHLSHIERWAAAQEQEKLDEIQHHTGVRVGLGQINLVSALLPALRKAGHEPPLTPKTRKPSIDKTWLQKCDSPVTRALLRARQWNKLRSTFCAQVRRFEINGRVHCTFNQLKSTKDSAGADDDKGTRYGRLSSTNFNVQQQPVRDDEFGHVWRAVFVPDLGARWCCADWRQQEPRIAVHYSERFGLPGAAAFARRYREDPNLDVHQALADLSGMPRKIVKNFVNGRLYGMGDAKLCRSLGLATERAFVWGEERDVPGPEGRALIERFNEYAPWIKGFTKVCQRKAEACGSVRTILRRRLNFATDLDGSYMQTHKAGNRVGQGSAADQMKLALIQADAAGIPIQLSVHDEFDFSFTDEAQARLLRDIQMNAVKFSVPMMVDLEVGENWGKLEKLS